MRFANFLIHIYLASKKIDNDASVLRASVSQNTRLKCKVHINGFHDQILSHVHLYTHFTDMNEVYNI